MMEHSLHFEAAVEASVFCTTLKNDASQLLIGSGTDSKLQDQAFHHYDLWVRASIDVECGAPASVHVIF